MASSSFNALGGITVGIPPVEVVDSNGNVVTNVFTSGNVKAANIYADNYKFSNGQAFTFLAAGSNTQVQFNNAGNLGASSALTFNSTNSTLTASNVTVTNETNLGAIENITMLGGVAGYFLQTDGTGNLTWSAAGGGGGNGSPGGANTQVQFNDAGEFGADTGFTYNKTTHTLSSQQFSASSGQITTTNSNLVSANYVVTSNITASNILDASTTTLVNLGNVSNVKITGGSTNYILMTDGVGNLSWVAKPTSPPGGANTQVQYNLDGAFAGSNKLTFDVTTGILSVDQVNTNNAFLGNTANANFFQGDGSLLSNITAANINGTVTAASRAATVTTNAQPNITSVGTLTGLVSTGVVNLVSASNVSLGPVTNVHITGGTVGQFLQTDGTGTLSWATAGGGGGNGTPGGVNTFVQFNDSGEFGGSGNFVYNNSTKTLTVDKIVSNGSGLTYVSGANVSGAVAFATTANAVAGANVSGAVSFATTANAVAGGNVSGAVGLATYATTANNVAGANVSGFVANANVANTAYAVAGANVSGAVSFATTANAVAGGNVSGAVGLATYATTANAVAGSNVSGQVGNSIIAGTVYTAAQPNITSVGTLSALNVTTTIATGNVSATGNLAVIGTANFYTSPLINLGSISNVRIGGGLNGYVIATDGTGNLTWTAQSGGGGGNGTPGGTNTQVQFNNAGDFGASSALTFNDSTKKLNVVGDVVANSFQMGTGINLFTTQTVVIANTSSITADQVLYTAPISSVVGADFVIVATDTGGTKRQISKVSSVTSDSTVAYNEYAGLNVGGQVGSFSVTYNAVGPNIQLQVTPSSANLTNYKIMVIQYAP